VHRHCQPDAENANAKREEPTSLCGGQGETRWHKVEWYMKEKSAEVDGKNWIHQFLSTNYVPEISMQHFT
jgi:hypothetical protein